MSCEEVKDLLALYAGGEAHDNERIAIEAHLGGCADCRCVLDEYRELRGQLADLKEGNAPAGAIESIWPHVKQEIAPSRRRTAPSFEWLVRIAAVVVIGVALGYAAGRFAPQAGGTPSQAPGGIARDAAAPTEYGTGGFAVPAGQGGGWGLGRPEFNLNSVPRRKSGTRADGSNYLPRVEKILDGDESDF